MVVINENTNIEIPNQKFSTTKVCTQNFTHTHTHTHKTKTLTHLLLYTSGIQTDLLPENDSEVKADTRLRLPGNVPTRP